MARAAVVGYDGPGLSMCRPTGGPDLDRPAPGEPLVATGRLQCRSDRAEHRAGFDHCVEPAQQPTGDVTLDGRVDIPHTRGIKELGAAGRRVGTGSGFGHQAELGIGSGNGQRAVGPETDAGTGRGDPLPEGPGPQGEIELLSGGSPADPDEPEVADGGPPRSGIAFELEHLPSTVGGLEGVHGTENPPAHDHHPVRTHRD